MITPAWEPEELWRTPSPEVHLALAVLSIAVRDLQHPSPQVRGQAEDFWQDTPALDFWAGVVGLDSAGLRRRLRAQLQNTKVSEPV
jgi:hypothetical protein